MTQAQKKKPKIEPLDFERCQAEIQHYRPFTMGGNVYQWERCKNVPAWVSREKKKGKDGLKGHMTLCDSCKAECEKKIPTGLTYTRIYKKPAVRSKRRGKPRSVRHSKLA